jgi:hypothetical protein
MQLSLKILSFLLLPLLPFSGSGMSSDTVRIEVLLNDQLLAESGIKGKFIQSFDITAERHILLSTNEKLYLLGWGGLLPIEKNIPCQLNSFSFTPDGFLMATRNSELVIADSSGIFRKLYNLPEAGMQLAAGKQVMYLYSSNQSKTKHILYAVARGGKFAKLFDVPSPITSVAEMGNTVLFASGNAVFEFTPPTKKLKALVTAPGNRTIISIAVDTLNKRIFFSTDSAVYSVKNDQPAVITDNLGGTIRYFKNALLVFNPERKLLVRMAGIEKILAALPMKTAAKVETSAKPPAEILTNTTITDLVKNNLSDELIISIINRSQVNFNLGIDAMIELSENHVSSAVIMAMKQAMKKQSLKTP